MKLFHGIGTPNDAEIAKMHECSLKILVVSYLAVFLCNNTNIAEILARCEVAYIKCKVKVFAVAYAACKNGPKALCFANLASGVTVKKIGTTGTASPQEIIEKWEEYNK